MAKKQAEPQLPQSPEVERSILGGLLIDPSAMEAVMTILEPSDFSSETNRRIFEAMIRLHEARVPLDHLRLAEELNRSGHLQLVGGYGGLVALDEGLPRMTNLESWAKVIRQKSLLRRSMFNFQNLIEQCGRPDADIAKIQKGALAVADLLSETSNGTGLLPVETILQELPNGLETFTDSARKNMVPSGFHSVDRLTGGFQPGDLILIGARPAAGKTSFVLNIAQHVAMNYNYPVAIFSLEMSRESLLARMACSISKVNQHSLRTGAVGEEERKRFVYAMNRLALAPIYIDDTPNCSLTEMRVKLSRMLRSSPPRLVIVDYLQLMAGSSHARYENQQVEVNRIANGLKTMAKELAVPVLACSQLSRAPELRKGDPRPKLSDLRDSGGLEQAADVVLFIFREEMYKQSREDLRGVAEIIVAKQRNGPTGTAKLLFLHGSTQFVNRVDDEPPPDWRKQHEEGN